MIGWPDFHNRRTVGRAPCRLAIQSIWHNRLVEYVATEAHEIPNRAPLQIEPGEVVSVGERDTTWPAFVFVTAAGGSGWVPARHLSAGSGPATVLTTYDTTELPVEAGDTVTVLRRDDESGWLWCRAESGREGWVPLRILEE